MLLLHGQGVLQSSQSQRQTNCRRQQACPKARKPSALQLRKALDGPRSPLWPEATGGVRAAKQTEAGRMAGVRTDELSPWGEEFCCLAMLVIPVHRGSGVVVTHVRTFLAFRLEVIGEVANHNVSCSPSDPHSIEWVPVVPCEATQVFEEEVPQSEVQRAPNLQVGLGKSRLSCSAEGLQFSVRYCSSKDSAPALISESSKLQEQTTFLPASKPRRERIQPSLDVQPDEETASASLSPPTISPENGHCRVQTAISQDQHLSPVLPVISQQAARGDEATQPSLATNLYPPSRQLPTPAPVQPDAEAKGESPSQEGGTSPAAGTAPSSEAAGAASDAREVASKTPSDETALVKAATTAASFPVVHDAEHLRALQETAEEPSAAAEKLQPTAQHEAESAVAPPVASPFAESGEKAVETGNAADERHAMLRSMKEHHTQKLHSLEAALVAQVNFRPVCPRLVVLLCCVILAGPRRDC